MRILVLYTYLFLSSFFAIGQKENIVIKVYLEDAETSKNICDAKVTLEGFEIPEIVGKYDKKGKYYYFDTIPKGYNTVMAYHEKYNEKGFQNTEELPDEIKLRLYTPFRVRIPGDSLNYYKEEPGKMVFLLNEETMDFVAECKDFKNGLLCSAQKYFSKNYPELAISNNLNLGSLSFDGVMVEKADRGKFSRFNDPIVKRLRADKNIVVFYGLLLKTKTNPTASKSGRTYFTKEGTPDYRAKYLEYIHFDTIRRFNKPGNDKSRYTNTGVNLEYREKYLKKQLVNDVYTITKREMDSLYALDKLKIDKGELYDYEDLDTITINMHSILSKMPTDEIKFLPYKAVSSILDYDFIDKSLKGDELIYSLFYSKEKINNYETKSAIIEKSSFNTWLTTYNLKYAIASPFGLIDLIEGYDLFKNGVYQKTEKNIQK